MQSKKTRNKIFYKNEHTCYLIMVLLDVRK
jgi:hypothetical protein